MAKKTKWEYGIIPLMEKPEWVRNRFYALDKGVGGDLNDCFYDRFCRDCPFNYINNSTKDLRLQRKWICRNFGSSPSAHTVIKERKEFGHEKWLREKFGWVLMKGILSLKLPCREEVSIWQEFDNKNTKNPAYRQYRNVENGEVRNEQL